jgi:hypothetical protein
VVYTLPLLLICFQISTFLKPFQFLFFYSLVHRICPRIVRLAYLSTYIWQFLILNVLRVYWAVYLCFFHKTSL